tara:strand:- start:954 stop:1187 length:234 start_codon:yes stop_codon:yes gene_type:complete
MNSNEEKINSEDISPNDTNSKEINIDEKSLEIEDIYKFGWGSYSETTNGRFAMLGFLAIILIELLSKQSFLEWAGIL